MMKHFLSLLLSCLLGSILIAQDTFSIVAVDTATGEVGSAGASCLDESQFPGSNGVQIIGRIYPGRGAINTQAYYYGTNQENAEQQLKAGKSPQEVIDWLVANDAFNNPTIRQYGIVDFDSMGHARAAAHTGVNCDDYKAHIVGENYAIQGNILLGQAILDSMEARFLATEGDLATKLMAALQGANVPGADTRCMSEGVSSLSAFLRVAQPSDVEGSPSLDLVVPQTAFGVEPIDELQALFDDVMTSFSPSLSERKIAIYPNPVKRDFSIEVEGWQPHTRLRIFAPHGRLLYDDEVLQPTQSIRREDLGGVSGLVFYQLWEAGRQVSSGKIVIQ